MGCAAIDMTGEVEEGANPEVAEQVCGKTSERWRMIMENGHKCFSTTMPPGFKCQMLGYPATMPRLPQEWPQQKTEPHGRMYRVFVGDARPLKHARNEQ